MNRQAADVEGRLTCPRAHPFRSDQCRLIVHCCYHEAGTHWLRGILQRVGKQFNLQFKVIQELYAEHHILFDTHSRIDVESLPAYRGSHMVRDSRDMVVSAYFYHLWTNERWVHEPQNEYGGLSYQQYLNSLNKEQGLIAEINRHRSCGLFTRMKNWNYQNDNMLELRYEEVIRDEEYHFTRLFTHYGFHDAVVKRSVRIALRHSFEAYSQRNLGEVRERSVMRSGEPGQWREHFSDPVKKRFKKVAGKLLRTLRYEENDDWQTISGFTLQLYKLVREVEGVAYKRRDTLVQQRGFEFIHFMGNHLPKSLTRLERLLLIVRQDFVKYGHHRESKKS